MINFNIRSVKPLVSLKMEGDFSRSVSSKEHFKPLPYSRTPVTIRKSMIEAPSGTIRSSTQLALIEPNIERRKLNRNFSKAIKLTDMLCFLFIS